jgi:hypothetical protein
MLMAPRPYRRARSIQWLLSADLRHLSAVGAHRAAAVHVAGIPVLDTRPYLAGEAGAAELRRQIS